MDSSQNPIHYLTSLNPYDNLLSPTIWEVISEPVSTNLEMSGYFLSSRVYNHPDVFPFGKNEKEILKYIFVEISLDPSLRGPSLLFL